jgi:hypothetical protein
MIHLRRPGSKIRHPDDVAKFREALAELGYTASDEDIQWAWSRFSEDMYAAGWLKPNSVEHAVKQVVGRLEVEG